MRCACFMVGVELLRMSCEGCAVCVLNEVSYGIRQLGCARAMRTDLRAGPFSTP